MFAKNEIRNWRFPLNFNWHSWSNLFTCDSETITLQVEIKMRQWQTDWLRFHMICSFHPQCSAVQVTKLHSLCQQHTVDCSNGRVFFVLLKLYFQPHSAPAEWLPVVFGQLRNIFGLFVDAAELNGTSCACVETFVLFEGAHDLFWPSVCPFFS